MSTETDAQAHGGGAIATGRGSGFGRKKNGRPDGSRPLHRLSFAGPVDRLNAFEPYLQLYQKSDREEQLYQLLLRWIAKDIVPYRPNRLEPRAVKRRPKQYSLLNRPRKQMRKALLQR